MIAKENGSKVCWVVFTSYGMRRQVIKIRLDNVLDIMKRIRHDTLKIRTMVLQTKINFPIGKGTPRENESSFVLILR
jgi:hypothetical protein